MGTWMESSDSKGLDIVPDEGDLRDFSVDDTISIDVSVPATLPCAANDNEQRSASDGGR